MINSKRKCRDIVRLQNNLKIDPKERTHSLLQEIYDEIQDLEFFSSLIQQNLIELVLNVCCKYMVYVPIKKKQIEGQLHAYIPTTCEVEKEEKQQQSLKMVRKKYIHKLHAGQCINLQSVCFKKITSFYFDCTENVTILSIPCNIESTSILTQIQPLLKGAYDFIFETLIQFDSFYTQQQVRDILFVSKKHHFKKGNIQLKHQGLIIFTYQGEFSIFKDFFKEKKSNRDYISERQYRNQGQDLNKLQNKEEEEEQDDEEDDEQTETEKGIDTIELQNLKVQYKKKNSQLQKRIRLGIKKPGSLIVLSRQDGSLDGIECLDNDGIAYICTEEQYEYITREQERKSDTSYATALPNKKYDENYHTKRNQQIGNNITDQNKIKHQKIVSPGVSESFHNDENDVELGYEKDLQAEDTQTFNTEIENQERKGIGQKVKDNSKGNLLRSKNELNYRKSLINNIGQSINTFGEFFYTSRKTQKQQKQQLVEQQQPQNQQPNLQKCLTERNNCSTAQKSNFNQPSSNGENLVQKNILIEEDKNIDKKSEQSQLSKKGYQKSTTLIMPFQKSFRNTVRGQSINQIQLQENSPENNSILNGKREQCSISPSLKNLQNQDSTIIKDQVFFKSNAIDINTQMRLKSAFQYQSGQSQSLSVGNTPVIRQGNNNSQNSCISAQEQRKTFFRDYVSGNEEISSSQKAIKIHEKKICITSSSQVPKIDLQGQVSLRNSQPLIPNSFEYNFISSNSDKQNNENTPSQTDSPQQGFYVGQSGSFSENLSQNQKRRKVMKKSCHYDVVKMNIFNDNSNNSTPQNKLELSKKYIKEVPISVQKPLQLHRQKFKTNSDYATTVSHKALSTRSINDEQNTTFNFLNHLTNKETFQIEKQRQDKSTPTNTINSLNHLPTSKTLTNINTSLQSTNILSFSDKRVQSAKPSRVKSSIYSSDHKKLHLQNEIHSFRMPDGVQTSRASLIQEKIQNKNIMQILYPSKMQKLDKQTFIKASKIQNKKETYEKPSSTSQIKSHGETSVQKDFQIFLQKKLRPQSAINSPQGQKQIDILNKRVYDQYIQSLNNTPSSKSSTQNLQFQKTHKDIDNDQ